MIGRPSIALLNAASRTGYRQAITPSSFRVTRASSSSSGNSSPHQEPPINYETSSTPKVSVAAKELKPYVPLYHHGDVSIFPPLIPGSLSYIFHNVSSAFNGLVALATSQEARDKFTSLTNLNESKRDSDEEKNNLYNGCIINTNVLGQSDMGFIKVLALFDGLNSPLYDTEGSTFNVREFLDGAGFALGRYREVCREHMEVFSEKLAKRADGESISYSFLDAAKSDPNSLEHDLMEMTTPIFWMYFDEWLKGIVNAPSFVLVDLPKVSIPVSKITHLALLSVRVIAVENPMPETNLNDKDESDAPLQDHSLVPLTGKIDSKTQIVTQIDVLYESEVTSPVRDPEGNQIQAGIQTEVSVDVATFEACIAGDPNGTLQWRICQNRPAFEFGYGVSFPSLNIK